jgi:flagellar basal-body rod modification protein FlgD
MTVPATSNGTTASQTTATSTSTSKSNTLDYNAFLKLLVAQLQHQDPTNPTDPTAFVSQLASFSSVEQQVNTNSRLDALLTQTWLSQAGSLIGRTVKSSDGLTSGAVASVAITTSGATATLTNGKTVTLGSGVTIS